MVRAAVRAAVAWAGPSSAARVVVGATATVKVVVRVLAAKAKEKRSVQTGVVGATVAV